MSRIYRDRHMLRHGRYLIQLNKTSYGGWRAVIFDEYSLREVYKCLAHENIGTAIDDAIMKASAMTHGHLAEAAASGSEYDDD